MLTGRQFEQLHTALLEAYTSSASLEQLVRFRLNVPLNNISSSNENLSKIVFQLLNWADANRKVNMLLDNAVDMNPDNKVLADAVREYYSSLTHPEPTSILTSPNFARAKFPVRRFLIIAAVTLLLLVVAASRLIKRDHLSTFIYESKIVDDKTGKPVANTEFEVKAAGGTTRVHTDSKGHFKLQIDKSNGPVDIHIVFPKKQEVTIHYDSATAIPREVRVPPIKPHVEEKHPPELDDNDKRRITREISQHITEVISQEARLDYKRPQDVENYFDAPAWVLENSDNYKLDGFDVDANRTYHLERGEYSFDVQRLDDLYEQSTRYGQPPFKGVPMLFVGGNHEVLCRNYWYRRSLANPEEREHFKIKIISVLTKPNGQWALATSIGDHGDERRQTLHEVWVLHQKDGNWRVVLWNSGETSVFGENVSISGWDILEAIHARYEANDGDGRDDS